jgi:undecaprenyl-diphosphatase
MEARLLLALRAQASPLLDAVFVLSNDLGTVYFFLPVLAAIALWHLGRGERRVAGLWVLAGLSTYFLLEGLKTIVARPRPALWPRLVSVGSSSFPSGHALATATFFPLLALDLTRGQSDARRAGAVLAGGLLSLFVGFGRLYLGVHWPTDVLAGWALGAAQCLAYWRWLRRGGNGPDYLMNR